MTNTIIDPIIFFKERNSYFFEPLHDGWHFTNVNNQPQSATGLFRAILGATVEISLHKQFWPVCS